MTRNAETTRNAQPHTGPGRPRTKCRPDWRITVRLRYHCDRDLIEALERTPNASKLIRDALRARVSASRRTPCPTEN